MGLRQITSASVLEDIRHQLQKLQAGSVELEKDADTGIAILTLNNPGRKNALSGIQLQDKFT